MNCRKVLKNIKEYVTTKQSVNKYKKCKICQKFSIKLHFFKLTRFYTFLHLLKQFITFSIFARVSVNFYK